MIDLKVHNQNTHHRLTNELNYLKYKALLLAETYILLVSNPL